MTWSLALLHFASASIGGLIGSILWHGWHGWRKRRERRRAHLAAISEAVTARPPLPNEIQCGKFRCFGVRPEFATTPITNLPPDALTVRRRIRRDAAMRVYVRTPGAVTCYAVGPAGGTFKGMTALELLEVRGVNTRRNA